jgi:hypothetical protein
MPSPIDATFCRLIGLYERKVPFENQPRCKNKMAAMFWFPVSHFRMPSLIDATFCKLIGLYERKVPFENQPRYKNKMATILNFGFRSLTSECLHRLTQHFAD